MKRFFKTLTISIAFFAIANVQNLKAESYVYFFWDCRTLWSDIPVDVNGEYAFSLIPEGRLYGTKSYTTTIYNKTARKVIFPTEGRYVFSSTIETNAAGIFHSDIILNLEEGETYYVLLDHKITHSFYLQELNKKQGEKLLKKYQKKSDKRTINPDFIYEK